MLSYIARVKEQAKSENDADDWRAAVDHEKEKLRNKKPWFLKRLWKAWKALCATEI